MRKIRKNKLLAFAIAGATITGAISPMAPVVAHAEESTTTNTLDDSVTKTETRVQIDNQNFPDLEFRGVIKASFDKNQDGWLDEDEMGYIFQDPMYGGYHDGRYRLTFAQDSVFKHYASKITNITGVEHFKKIKELIVHNTNIKGNMQTITNMTELETLSFNGNYNLTGVNVTGLTKLKRLLLGERTNNGLLRGTNLSAIDVTTNTALEELDISIDYRSYSKNQLQELDLSKNTNLRKLTLSNIGNATGKRFTLKGLDNLTNLEELYISSCNIVGLDNFDFSKLTNLKKIVIYGSNLGSTWKTFDLSKLDKVTYIDIKNTDIESIKLSSQTEQNITYLSLKYNENLVYTLPKRMPLVETIDIQESPYVLLSEGPDESTTPSEATDSTEATSTEQQVNKSEVASEEDSIVNDTTEPTVTSGTTTVQGNNKLKGYPKLKYLNISGSWSYDYDTGLFTKFVAEEGKTLRAETVLDLSNNHEILEVYASFNPIAELKAPTNSKLTTLELADSKLIKIDYNGNETLETLKDVTISGLTEQTDNLVKLQLDLDKVPNIEVLTIGYQVGFQNYPLDLTKLKKLKTLTLSHSDITVVNLDAKDTLTNLYLYDTRITGINLDGYSKLSFTDSNLNNNSYEISVEKGRLYDLADLPGWNLLNTKPTEFEGAKLVYVDKEGNIFDTNPAATAEEATTEDTESTAEEAPENAEENENSADTNLVKKILYSPDEAVEGNAEEVPAATEESTTSEYKEMLLIDFDVEEIKYNDSITVNGVQHTITYTLTLKDAITKANYDNADKVIKQIEDIRNAFDAADNKTYKNIDSIGAHKKEATEVGEVADSSDVSSEEDSAEATENQQVDTDVSESEQADDAGSQTAETKISESTNSEIDKIIAELNKKDVASTEQEKVDDEVAKLEKALKEVVYFADYSPLEDAVSKALETLKEGVLKTAEEVGSEQVLNDGTEGEATSTDPSVTDSEQGDEPSSSEESEETSSTPSVGDATDSDNQTESTTTNLTEDPTNYTTNSKYEKSTLDILIEKLKEGQKKLEVEQKEREDSTQTDAIKKLADEINQAVSGLTVIPANYEKLQNAINTAEDKIKDDGAAKYRTSTVDALEKAIEEGKQKLTEEAKKTQNITDQTELDALADKITEAVNNLKPYAALTDLEDAIKEAITKLKEGVLGGSSDSTEVDPAKTNAEDYKTNSKYTTETFEALITEIKKGQDILNATGENKKTTDDDAQIKTLTETIRQKVTSLVEQSGSYDKLDTAINNANNKISEGASAVTNEDGSKSSKYTDDSINRLQEAITKAEEYKKTNDKPVISQQTEIDNLQKEIERLTSSLTENGKADYDEVRKALEDAKKALEELQTQLEEAKKALQDAQSGNGGTGDAGTTTETDIKNSQDSIDRLQEAIDEGEKDLNDPKTEDKQSDVDDLAEKIKDATESLRENGEADYKAVVEAITEAEKKLNDGKDANGNSIYTEETEGALKKLVEEAQNELNTGRKKSENQSEVDNIAQKIKDATNALAEKSADYTKLEDAIKKAEEAIKNGKDANTGISKYTEDSVKRLQDAIDQAKKDKETNPKTITDQALVDEATSDIERLTKSLTEKGKADYDDVRKALEEAEKTLEEAKKENEATGSGTDSDSGTGTDGTDKKYTDDSIKRLEEAIEEAKKELENPKDEEKQSEVDDLADKLKDVADALVEEGKADYIDVITAITEAENKLEEGKLVDKTTGEVTSQYTDETKKALEDAINKAKEELKNPKSKDQQADVTKLAEEIKDAISKLETKGANYEKLDEAIQKGEDKKDSGKTGNTSKYTDESVKRLEDAIEKATNEKTTNPRDITQQLEIDDQQKEIELYTDSLTEKGNADYNDVIKALEDAKAKVEEGKNEDGTSKYTDSTIKKLEELIKQAEDEIANPKADSKQSEVDKLAEDIERATNTVIEKGQEDEFIEVTKFDFNRDDNVTLSDILVMVRIINEVNEPNTPEETEFVNYIFDRNYEIGKGDTNIGVYDLLGLINQFNEVDDTYTIKLPAHLAQYYKSLGW